MNEEMLEKYGWYNLKKGEEIKILNRSDAIFSCPLSKDPTSIEVIQEYPMFINCKAKYYGLHKYSFSFCINKADLVSGKVQVKRKNGTMVTFKR